MGLGVSLIGPATQSNANAAVLSDRSAVVAMQDVTSKKQHYGIAQCI